MAGISLDSVDIARVLETTSVGHVHFLSETPSTNEVAMLRAAALQDRASELVLAASQTQGKGRGKNRWHSGQGSLTFSLITPALPIEPGQTPQVSLVAGLAICQALEAIAPRADARLKWPNDVYLDGRKAAGVLIEVPRQSVTRFVVGIGVNVNNSLADVPQEVRPLAISLAEAAGGPVSMTDVLIGCLNHFDQCLAMLISGDNQLPGLWRACNLLSDKRVSLRLPSGLVQGVCSGIADDGALILTTDAGPTSFYGGVVESFI